MATRGANSKSFLRERDDFTVVIGSFVDSYDFENVYDMQTVMHQKDANGKFVYSKKQIFEITENLGYNKHIVVNAKNLLGMNSYKIQKIINEFKEYLDDLGISGILEFHANDKTQKSFHFHFWTNNDDVYVKNSLIEFVLDNKLADVDNVNIQGDYANFIEMRRLAREEGLSERAIDKTIREAKRARVEKANDVIEEEIKDAYKPKENRAKSLIEKMREQMQPIINYEDIEEIETDDRKSESGTIRYKQAEEINAQQERNRALYQSAHRELTKREFAPDTNNLRTLSRRDLAHLRERPKMLLQDDTHNKLRIERLQDADIEVRWANTSDSGTTSSTTRSIILKIKRQAEATKELIDSLYNSKPQQVNMPQIEKSNVDSIYEQIAKRSEEVHRLNQLILKRNR